MQISLANLFIILEDPIQSALLKFTKKSWNIYLKFRWFILETKLFY
jgi:hypothetical protein